MKQNAKRLFGILLSLALMLGLMTGMTAYAETGHIHDSTTFENAWSSNNSLPAKSGSYYLTTDVTISSTWIILDGTTNLCLNGHKITYSSNGHPTEEVIWNSGNSTLNLYDCKASGIITGGNCGVCNSGRFNMHGGTISGNEGTTDGAGVLNHVSFTMSGGKICGNKAVNTRAGGGSGGGVRNNGTFTMSGGEISGNTAIYQGGGVYNHTDAIFTMSGGKISGNTNEQPYGGGIENFGTFQVSGSPIITGNTAGGAGNNVRLTYGSKISIKGPLTAGASVGVKLNDNIGTFTSGYKTYNGNTAPSAYFSSDDNSYIVTKDSNGEAQLVDKHTVTIPKIAVEQPKGVKAKAKKNKVTVSWKEIGKKDKKLKSQVKSIQVQYATDKAFTQNVVTKSVGKNKTKVVLNLKKKTQFFIRVRYVGVDGISRWSSVKRVKTK